MRRSRWLVAAAALVVAAASARAQTSSPGAAGPQARVPGAADLRIVQRASEILRSPAAWNQTDRQNSCTATAQTFGLYCLLKKASEDVTGTFDHGSLVMDEARDVIDFVAMRDYGARLIGYNNDSTTSFADMQALLRILHNRFVKRIEAANTVQTPAAPSTCRLHAGHDRWTGSCGVLLDGTPVLSISPARAIATGLWRRDAQPSEVWAGAMKDTSADDPHIEVEIYAGGSGVIRTQYGWFPVTAFARRDSTLTFQVDGEHEVPPNDVDREILKRAAAILTSDAVWNRADTRDCPSSATTWSIYCAVTRASIEVTGGFHHRRPAAQLVRQIVDERSKGRSYGHRLMDYNNDRTTKLEDVRTLFAEALKRVG
jgi:hypothetical protein